MAALIFWATLFAMLAIGVPVAFSLAAGGFAIALLVSDLPLRAVVTVFAQNLYGGVDSFLLLALPLFFFAGSLMEGGGISDRLVRLGLVMIGWVRGGLSMVAVVTGIFLSGISGSASSDAAAIGSVLIPAMKKRGYPAGYASAVAASAGGTMVAVSSPQGDLLVAIDTEGRHPVLVETLRNGCGLAADGAGFVATSGEGEMIGIAGAEREARRFDFRFDNHMLRMG